MLYEKSLVGLSPLPNLRPLKSGTIFYTFLYLQKRTINFIYKKGIPIPRSHPWSCLCFLKEMSYLEEAPLQQWESLPYIILDIKMKVSPGYYIGNPCGRGEEGSTNRTGFRYKCIVNQNLMWQFEIAEWNCYDSNSVKNNYYKHIHITVLYSTKFGSLLLFSFLWTCLIPESKANSFGERAIWISIRKN